ncbi:MAG TPA: hypothetical protein VM942_04685 [Acidimicrobiales bacterium]|nr:hypothetical protein [Acidimicrobiales bacterium]
MGGVGRGSILWGHDRNPRLVRSGDRRAGSRHSDRSRPQPSSGHEARFRPSIERVLDLQRTAGNAVVTRLMARSTRASVPEAVQRLVTMAPGQVNETLNQVDPLMPGTDFGTTFIRVNGVEHPPASLAGAVARPGLSVVARPGGQADVSVSAEPVNSVSFRMDVPSPPPWTKTVSKDEASTRLKYEFGEAERQRFMGVLGKYMDHEGTTKIRATGAPNDSQFKALVRAHELVHVDHIQEAYDNILAPWDARVRGYKAPATPFLASSAGTAAQEFDQSVVPAAEVGDLLQQHFKQRGLAFHDSTEGAKPVVDDVSETGILGKTLNFRWRHPLS